MDGYGLYLSIYGFGACEIIVYVYVIQNINKSNCVRYFEWKKMESCHVTHAANTESLCIVSTAYG